MQWNPKPAKEYNIGDIRERRVFCWLPRYGSDQKMHWLEYATIREHVVVVWWQEFPCWGWQEVDAPRDTCSCFEPPQYMIKRLLSTTESSQD